MSEIDTEQAPTISEMLIRLLHQFDHEPDEITKYVVIDQTEFVPAVEAQIQRLLAQERRDSYQRGRDSVGGESVGEAWERGRRVGLRAFELYNRDNEYFKTRESIINALCTTLWMKTWDEAKDNERRFEHIMGFMRHFDLYVDKRIEDSYSPAEPRAAGELGGKE